MAKKLRPSWWTPPEVYSRLCAHLDDGGGLEDFYRLASNSPECTASPGTLRSDVSRWRKKDKLLDAKLGDIARLHGLSSPIRKGQTDLIERGILTPVQIATAYLSNSGSLTKAAGELHTSAPVLVGLICKHEDLYNMMTTIDSRISRLHLDRAKEILGTIEESDPKAAINFHLRIAQLMDPSLRAKNITMDVNHTEKVPDSVIESVCRVVN